MRVPKSRKYFYLNGELHKQVHVDRAADTVDAYKFSTCSIETYPWSLTKRRKRPAFRLKEAGLLLNRGHLALERAILRGDVSAPQKSHPLGQPEKAYQYWLSEENILEIHAYLATVHIGRPRKDGLVTNNQPTLRELKAMMNDEEVLYVKVGDEYKPTWAAPDLY